MISGGEMNSPEKGREFLKKKVNPMNKKVGRLTQWSLDNDACSCSHIEEQEDINAENLENGKLKMVNVGKPTCRIIKRDASNNSWKEHDCESNMGCPSKNLIMCLNTIQNALQQDEASPTVGDRPFFANEWGIEFWNSYTNGKDVFETNGDDSTIEKIAWMTSTAADIISMKEKEGLSFNGPFLLYLIPSQEKANKVREVCKPLKVVGIHTVSLHSAASIDHQIQGLKRCEPEFIVSTPKRLLELLSLNVVDISELSLMAIDGLETPFRGTYFDEVKSIRQFIYGNPQTVVFSDYMNNHPFPSVHELLGPSDCK